MITTREFEAECLCLNVQRAARRLARRYDEALRPAGLTSGQFAILAALLDGDAPVPLTMLAPPLGLDRTTLSRNLAPLEAAGLVASSVADGDRRVRGVALTAAGRRRMVDALPLWRAAQAAASGGGDAHWPALRTALANLG